MDYMGSILAMVICIAMSAYFSATETAFSSLNKTRLKVLADNGNRRAALTLKLAENYDKLISTILIGNNIVNILVASIGTLLFVGLYGDMGATISTVVVTVVVLIFGEITPKSVAKDAPERFAMVSAPFIRLWIWVLTPLNFLFSQWKKLISRFFKTDENAKMSHEELLLFMEDVEQDGGIDENEGELLRNALEFRDLTAAEILTHRIELEAVEIQESHEQIAKAFTQSGFSRLLVYRDTIDQVVGVVKAYSSCVGEGPFTCEWFGADADKLREAGAEYGAKTGRPRRVGPIDLVATRYGVEVQGATNIALTKLDILSYMKEIPVCAAYEIDGRITREFPFPAVLEKAKPVMEYRPGWCCDISAVRTWEDMPQAARDYVEYVEQAIGCHIGYVSVGAERESLIVR